MVASLYWVKWKSLNLRLFPDSPQQGFDEMEDMFRYSGDMPTKVYKRIADVKSSPFDIFYVEFKSIDPLWLLNKRTFARWHSFGAFTKYIDSIKLSPDLKNYKYNPTETKDLFNKLLEKGTLGAFADW